MSHFHYLPFILSVVVLSGAYGFEWLGYQPCALCLQGRYVWWGIVLLSPIMWLLPAAWRKWRWYLLLLMAVILFGNFVFSVYHAGVEWHWWAGPSTCGNSGISLQFGDVFAASVACDEAAWRFLDISLAGYNGLISLGLAVAIGLVLAEQRHAK